MTTQVTGYRVVEFLGSGGIADVYEATSDRDGRNVALKILREPERSRANVRRFLREGYLLQRLPHPGLPLCHEVLEEPRPCLVLEVLHGETLSSRVSHGGALPADEVFNIALAVLRVLAFLHQRGVIHRDVKASNIYLCTDGRVLLLDLGLAMDPEDPFTTTLGDVMGTYAYMAPEQIAGAEVDPRSDLYSLGITLYEALAGTRPYSARGTAGYLRAHRSGGAQPLTERVASAPIRLMDFIHHLMARDPSARPPSAGIAIALLTGRSGGHNELRPPPLVGRWGPRGSIEAVIDGGGAVLLVGEIGAGTGRMARLSLSLASESCMETLALRFRSLGVQRQLLPQLANGLRLVLHEPVLPQEEAVGQALEQLVAEGPFLLLMEDLQLAGEEDRQRLRRLLSRVPGISVVTTSLFPIDGVPGREVLLRGLNQDEVGKLVAGMLGTSTPPGDLAGLLHRETGGLPALVVLAVREFHKRGALRCDGIGDDGEPRWLMDAGTFRLGTVGLRPLFRQALVDLPPGSRRVLDLLAVAATPVLVEVAVEAAGLDPSALDVHMLLRLGLANQDRLAQGDFLSIRRAAVALLMLDTMDAEQRRSIHRALAAALTKQPSSPERDEALSLHVILGTEGDGAARSLVSLGSDALAQGFEQRAWVALEHLGQQPPEDPSLSAQVAFFRGRVMLQRGRLEEARIAFVAARQLAREIRDMATVCRATLGLAAVQLQTGSGIRCEALTLEAERLGQGAELGAWERSRIQYLRGVCSLLRGSEKAALDRLGNAAREASLVGEVVVLARIRCAVAAVHTICGRHEQAGHYLESEARRLSDRPPTAAHAEALLQLALLRVIEGDLGIALDKLERAGAIARRLELPYLEARIGTARASVHVAAGDTVGATHLLRRHRSARERRSDAFTRLQYHVVAGEVRLAAGDRQAALASFDQATDVARKLGHAVLAAYCEGVAGVLTASANPLEEALDLLEKVGARGLMARLLLAGAQVVGDASAIAAAVNVARTAGDRPLLLRALHAHGGEDVWAEAVVVAMDLRDRAGPHLAPHVRAMPAVRWAFDSERRS